MLWKRAGEAVSFRTRQRRRWTRENEQLLELLCWRTNVVVTAEDAQETLDEQGRVGDKTSYRIEERIGSAGKGKHSAGSGRLYWSNPYECEHNAISRARARARVRDGIEDALLVPVTSLDFAEFRSFRRIDRKQLQ